MRRRADVAPVPFSGVGVIRFFLADEERVTCLVCHKLADVEQNVEQGARQLPRLAQVAKGKVARGGWGQHVLHLAHYVIERDGRLGGALHAVQLLLVEKPACIHSHVSA